MIPSRMALLVILAVVGQAGPMSSDSSRLLQRLTVHPPPCPWAPAPLCPATPHHLCDDPQALDGRLGRAPSAPTFQSMQDPTRPVPHTLSCTSSLLSEVCLLASSNVVPGPAFLLSSVLKLSVYRSLLIASPKFLPPGAQSFNTALSLNHTLLNHITSSKSAPVPSWMVNSYRAG